MDEARKGEMERGRDGKGKNGKRNAWWESLGKRSMDGGIVQNRDKGMKD